MQDNTKIITVSGWAFPADALIRLTSPIADYAPPELDILADRITSAPSPVVLIGWSMGAMTCLETAIKLKEKIASLILISGTGRFCYGPDYAHGTLREGLDTMIDGIYKKPRWTLEAFYKKSFMPKGYSPPILNHLLKGAFAASQEKLADGLKYMREFDVRSTLASLNMPVLLIHGNKDRIVPAGASEYLSRNIPNSRLQLIEDAGHAIPLTHAENISDAISSFLTHKT